MRLRAAVLLECPYLRTFVTQALKEDGSCLGELKASYKSAYLRTYVTQALKVEAGS